VEAVRAAADAGDFAAYIAAQGGANVSRKDQTVRVARRVADEMNAYDEDVQKVVGIFAPHLGDSHIYETRTTQWRIVSSAVDVNSLTLKSGSAAPRSPVNNCGLAGSAAGTNRQKSQNNRPESHTVTAENDTGSSIDWNDTAAVRAIVARIRKENPRINKAQRSYDPTKWREIAPSARLTPAERARLPMISSELAKHGIAPERWELEALTRGAKITFGDVVIHLPPLPDWADFYGVQAQ
jgi:hypothetical protein